MLTFPQILIGVFTAAGLLLAVILLVVLLPRRDESRPPVGVRSAASRERAKRAGFHALTGRSLFLSTAQDMLCPFYRTNTARVGGF